MPSATFTGAGFFVANAAARSATVVRVTFNNVPLATSPAGLHDALNIANYTFTGPGPASVASVAPVSGIPEAYDVTLTGPLNIGTWTVTVANVQDVDTTSLTAPLAAVFTVSVLFPITPLAAGATNDTSESIIRKHLSPALKGPTWDALIAALSSGDSKNWANAESAFDQLFLSTASGSWLERRAGDEGITKPVNVGISDSLFRSYATKLSTKKVVHQAIREILEVFYGQDAERAFIEAQIDEPYNLAGRPDLTWSLNEIENFLVFFDPSWFATVSAATAVEVAVALTKYMQDQGSDGFAVPIRSPITAGKNRVRIYSSSLGLGSFARCTGGLAQNIFQFPTLAVTYSGTITGATGYNWVYTIPTPGVTRVSLTATGAGCLVDLSKVVEGDYVIITTGAGIGLTGTFPVSNVKISWSGGNLIQSFDLPLLAFTGTALQQNNLAYTFYHPTKSSILAAGGRTVLVASPHSGRIDISIPATTQAVGRGPKSALYLRSNPDIAIQTMQRAPNGTVTVTTASPHGLQVGQQVLVDGFQPKASLPLTGAAQTAVSPFQAPASWVNMVAQSAATPVHATSQGAACALASGQILFAGGVSGASGAAVATCNRFQVNASAPFTSADEANGAPQWSYQWNATGSLGTARIGSGLSALGTGAIVTGGYNGSTFFQTTEIYDSVGNSWSSGPAMAGKRALHGQITLANGTVLVVGGALTVGLSQFILGTTEIYNGSTWTAGGGLAVNRISPPVVQLSNGTIMVIGGYADQFSSTATQTVEISTNNGASWSFGAPMGLARGDHRAVLLPGDYVLVTGGWGYNPTNPTVSSSLNQAELYDPNTNRWYPVQAAGMTRSLHLAVYSPTLNQVLVAGGSSTTGSDCTVVEAWDVATRTWKAWPTKLAVLRNYATGAITPSGLIPVMGGSSPVPDTVAMLIPASEVVSTGTMNGQFVVTATPVSPLQFQFQTLDRTGLAYTSNIGNANIGKPVAHLVSAQPQPVNDPGPYLFDPQKGVSVTGTTSTIASFQLFKGQQYPSIVIAGQGAFPNAAGWIVLGFGTSQQTPPIAVQGTFADVGGNTRLLIDFGYRFTSNFPIGSVVTLLSQRSPFVPAHPEQVGSSYVTASTAGRVAAGVAARAALAAGITPNINIVYPGDRGLGGEGQPTHGTAKLSDIVEVFAGDDINDDLETAENA